MRTNIKGTYSKSTGKIWISFFETFFNENGKNSYTPQEAINYRNALNEGIRQMNQANFNKKKFKKTEPDKESYLDWKNRNLGVNKQQ